MPRYRRLSDDLREAAVHMRFVVGLETKPIVMQLSLHQRTIEKIVKHFIDTGQVSATKEPKKRQGKLNSDHAAVCDSIQDPPLWHIR